MSLVYLILHFLKWRGLRGDLNETYNKIFKYSNLEDIEIQNLFCLVKFDKTRKAEGEVYLFSAVILTDKKFIW